MILSELWGHYEVDKRIQGFSPKYTESLCLAAQDAGQGSRDFWTEKLVIVEETMVRCGCICGKRMEGY